MRTALLRPALALAIVAIVVAACSSSGSSAAPSTSAAPAGSAAAGGAMTVTDAWARAMPPGQTTSAVYLTITNGTGQDDALVSVSTNATATAEIHEVMTVSAAPAESAGMGGGLSSAAPAGGGMMGMQPIAKLPIPAGGTVELKPGAYHIMLVDVKDPLKDGATIEVTLNFEKAAPITLTVPVKMS